MLTGGGGGGPQKSDICWLGGGPKWPKKCWCHKWTAPKEFPPERQFWRHIIKYKNKRRRSPAKSQVKKTEEIDCKFRRGQCLVHKKEGIKKTISSKMWGRKKDGLSGWIVIKTSFVRSATLEDTSWARLTTELKCKLGAKLGSISVQYQVQYSVQYWVQYWVLYWVQY